MLFMLALLLSDFLKSESKTVVCLELHTKCPGVGGFKDLKIYGQSQR